MQKLEEEKPRLIVRSWVLDYCTPGGLRVWGLGEFNSTPLIGPDRDQADGAQTGAGKAE